MPKNLPAKLKTRWFQVDNEEQMATLIHANISQWQVMAQWRLWDLLKYARLYGTQWLGFSSLVNNRIITTRNKNANPLACTFNGTKSTIDTVTAKIAQHHPPVRFTPTDGDWKAHKTAAQRNRFLAGLFYANDVYAKGRMAFLDSAVWGDGLIQVYARNGKIRYERIFPGDLYINPSETVVANNLTELGVQKLMDRTDAYYMLDEDPAVLDAPQVKISIDGVFSDNSDIIRLNEIWRLPSYEGAGDGRHVIATENAIITDDEWKHPNFPFARVQCMPNLYGYWSEGFCELLQNTQLQYDEISFAINEAIELGGYFKIFNQSSENIVVEELDNEIGSVLRGDAPPTSLLWELVQPEIWQRLATLKDEFYQLSGVSQMNAMSEKPAGDESGVALREANDIYTERFSIWVESFQEMYKDLAKLSIQCLTDILEDQEQKSYEVYSVGNVADPIDFAELGFEKDEQYQITCEDVNDVSGTLEDRFATASEFVNSGWYDERTAREVFQLPDTSRIENLYNATYEYVDMITDMMIEDGTYTPPDPLDNLQLCLTLATQKFNYARTRHVSQGRTDLIRRFISETQTLVQQAMPPPMPQAAPQPLGNAPPPPTADLGVNPNAAPPMGQ